MTWKPEDTETLRKAWFEGASVPEIREMLGGRFTKSAVIGKAHRLKLPPHPNGTVITNKGGRPRKNNATEARASALDPKRADKLLRRFSWQEEEAA